MRTSNRIRGVFTFPLQMAFAGSILVYVIGAHLVARAFGAKPSGDSEPPE